MTRRRAGSATIDADSPKYRKNKPKLVDALPTPLEAIAAIRSAGGPALKKPSSCPGPRARW
jgi:hypothetical protein